jgi:DNA-directed RNA polymerase subunit RPC12/RpoP
MPSEISSAAIPHGNSDIPKRSETELHARGVVQSGGSMPLYKTGDLKNALVEETDYECPRCFSRYVLMVSVDLGEESSSAKDFICRRCGRHYSEFQPAGLPGSLIAYRSRD